MSLRASCRAHLMSAFDKSANSKARGLEKLLLALGVGGKLLFKFSAALIGNLIRPLNKII